MVALGTTVAASCSHNALTKLCAGTLEVAASINQYHKNLRYIPDFNLADNLKLLVG